MNDTSWRDDIEFFPVDLQEEVEPRLEGVLRGARDKLGAEHAFISFVQPETRTGEANLFRFSNGLWIGEERLTLHVLNIRQGLTGRVVREGRILRYPTDADASASFVKSDSRVGAEIVGPVRFKGKVTGVVVLDRVSRNGAEPAPFSTADKDRFINLLEEIEAILLEVEYATEDTRMAQKLQQVAEWAVELTRATKRGYVAIKRPFGRVSYYPAGQGVESFRHLATDEGLTGKVLRTGDLINCHDVLDDEDYVVSDREIRSELVVPIKIGEETAGIINVESTAYRDYGDVDVKKLVKEAEKVARSIELQRTSTRDDFYYALGDLSTQIAQLRVEVARRDELEDRMEAEIVRALLKAARATLGSGDCGFWPGEGSSVAAEELGSKDPPAAVRRLLDHGRKVLSEATVEETAEGRLLAAPLFASEGIHLGAVWLRIDRLAKVRDPRAKLEQLCLMATSAIKEWRREHRLREFLELTDLLVESDPSPGVLEQVVRKVPGILQSDYCSLFHRVEYDNERILVPTVSTVPLPLETRSEGGEPFYRWRPEDGLTACAASMATVVCLRDVEHAEELEDLRKELGLPELQWKRHLSEDLESRCRSFMAFPVSREGSEEVIGVIRTHRTRQNPRSGFSDEEQQQMSLIARLLSPILSRYLGSAPGSAPEPAE